MVPTLLRKTPVVLVGLVAVFSVLNKFVIPLWTKRKDATPSLPVNRDGGASSSSSHTSNSPPPWKHDVFLSFAGKNTRLTFVDHLDEAFNRSGIKTFKDDKDLERGGAIKQDLIQAIRDSLCAVVVISENYADSIWCLDELQEILRSRETLGQRVFPIFYNVDPADVRHQRESFGKALTKHEKKFRNNPTKVQNWRNALSQIGNISGHDTRGKHEAGLMRKIVEEVWSYLSSKLTPSYKDNLVGIESRVADMEPLLEIGKDESVFVGIWGMGGVGKSTLARVLCEQLSHQFQVCFFLTDARKTSSLCDDPDSLTKKMLLSHLKIKDVKISYDDKGMQVITSFLYNKKALIVLDDLDDMSQLCNLAQSPDCFGKGSRVIITTRDRHLLKASGVKEERIYKLETMMEDESLQLFSNKAFHKDHPPDEIYLKLSESVVEYAGGLPLALEVLGSFLYGRSEPAWRGALDRLKRTSEYDDRILETLKISYDGLKNGDKEIFLDIACIFKGWQKKKVTQILISCDLNPEIGIDVLIEKALLIETESGTLDMHDLLRDLGRYIVHQEYPNDDDVGKRSRLWKFEDIKEVLENNKGSKAIKAIVLPSVAWEMKIEVDPEAFSKMSNIRFLQLDSPSNNQLIMQRGLKLSRALKAVRWPSFPLEALPVETPLDKLGYIEMHHSNIKQLWNGRHVMNKLKFIDLSYSHNLTETPDFSGVSNLERLCLSFCQSLVKVHESLGKLKVLIEVYLDSCENLEILPNNLETDSLRELSLRGCSKVAVLPEFGKGMKKLSNIDVSYTSITKLPESLGSLTSLRDLNLCGCKNLFHDESWQNHINGQIPGLLNVTSLTELHLDDCSLNDGSIPDDFGSLSSLAILSLTDNDFVTIPIDCFSSLDRLAILLLDGCKKLKSLPKLPPQLIRLDAIGCNSMEPLSDVQLWNLVASLDHENRDGRTKYVVRRYDDDMPWVFKQAEQECVSLRDFFAIIPGSEIPSWFPNTKDYALGRNRREYEIKVNIPQHFDRSKWSGIVVCLRISSSYDGWILWNSKAEEDDYYIFKDWAHTIIIWGNNSQIGHMCIMVLELNEETCWRHLRRSHHNSLHIKLSTYNISYSEGQILGCGWRVICKEEIQAWCTLNNFKQFTQPLLASSDDIIMLPSSAPVDLIEKVYIIK